jgi:AcrR family transcriptional regulator
MVKRHESTKVRQGQIVNAARKVIIKYGSEHVTVKRIAKEVGISEAAIYRHFRSKKEILSLLADYIGNSLVGDVARASTEGRMPLEILDSVLRSQLSTVEQRRGISFQIIAEIISLGDRKLNEKIAHAIDRYTNSLKNLLVEAVKAGEVREDIDPDIAATALFGIIQGLVNTWALNNYNFDPQQKYVALWSIFREAVIKR